VQSINHREKLEPARRCVRVVTVALDCPREERRPVRSRQTALNSAPKIEDDRGDIEEH
jgi:hypothetical protein